MFGEVIMTKGGIDNLLSQTKNNPEYMAKIEAELKADGYKVISM